jgi:hypothetical protein
MIGTRVVVGIKKSNDTELFKVILEKFKKG